MDEDRTTWGAREYADALNNAATPTDLFDLVEEVNQIWATADDLAARAEAIHLVSRLAARRAARARETRSTA